MPAPQYSLYSGLILMTIPSERPFKTGGDPRTFADYAALRNEMNKLTHPARPDVDWKKAENLCLSLFEHNGVELQTAAWYTLARTHLAGLSGLNEGLAIVAALLTRQWDKLWPQPVHARMDILNALSKRLQRVSRILILTSADLTQLYQAQMHLKVVNDVLQRQKVMSTNQLDSLRAYMHNAALRLEKNTGKSGNERPYSPDVNAQKESTEHLIQGLVTQPESQQGVMAEKPSPVKPWKPFAAGMMTMLVLAGTVTWGWQAMRQPDPAQEALVTRLFPDPAVLSDEWLASLRQNPVSPDTGIRQTQQQLTRLLQLEPDWAVSYGDSLVQQALRLWPEQSSILARQWQQQKVAITLAPENLTGWHQGMLQLEQLANRLNALDEQKGKYMTVSELKSAVFSISQAFNCTVPVEEQLRQLSVISAGQASHDIRQRQIEQYLQQLIASWAALKQTPAE